MAATCCNSRLVSPGSAGSAAKAKTRKPNKRQEEREREEHENGSQLSFLSDRFAMFCKCAVEIKPAEQSPRSNVVEASNVSKKREREAPKNLTIV